MLEEVLETLNDILSKVSVSSNDEQPRIREISNKRLSVDLHSNQLTTGEGLGEAAEALNDILSKVSVFVDGEQAETSCSLYEHTSFDFSIDCNSYRCKTEESDIELSDSDSDDEAEFQRILSQCRTDCNRDKKDQNSSTENGRQGLLIEREYESLPAIELLTIHADDQLPLALLGKVSAVVDCLVVVQADSNVALNYETVLFNINHDAIGEVFDVFGAVAKPCYAIRFNTPEQANVWSVGTEVYYIPSVPEFTKTILTDKLRSEKVYDSNWDGDGECSESDMVFSDDESERRYISKHRHKKGKGGDVTNEGLKRQRLDNGVFGSRPGYRSNRGTFGFRGRGFGNASTKRDWHNRGWQFYPPPMAWPPPYSAGQ